MYPKEADNNQKQFILGTYLFELATQCDFAKLSMAYLRFALEAKDLKLAFYSSHSFLNHVGNISKLLWPDVMTKRKIPESIERGKELRRVLKISENSSLKDKTFRNHFEHYDSRIDEWVLKSKHHVYVDMLIGPVETISAVDFNDIMRHFNPDTFLLSFHGGTYDLVSAEKEVTELLNKILEISPKIRMATRKRHTSMRIEVFHSLPK